MKINDKALAYFSSSSQVAPDKCGWLWKKGELNTSYQKRWCVLKGNLFFYFERNSDKEPIGVIVIENCSVQLAEGGDSPYTFSISFDGSGLRVYKLTADDEDTCNEWVRALSIASYSYLEILVDALEKELGELTANKARSSVTNMSENVPTFSSTSGNDRTCVRGNMSQDSSKISSFDNNLKVPTYSEKKKKSPGLKRKKNKTTSSFFIENTSKPSNTVRVKAHSIQVMNYSDRPFAALHTAYQNDIKDFVGEKG